MTLKALAEAKFSTALFVANTPQFFDIYTVPAGKTALVKEILAEVTKRTNAFFHIYILKSAGQDLPVAANAVSNFAAIENAGTAADVVPQTADGGLSVLGLTVLARTTIMQTGDKLRLMAQSAIADAADANRLKVYVSGDEF